MKYIEVIKILQVLRDLLIKMLGYLKKIKDNTSISGTKKDGSGRVSFNSVFGEQIVASELSSFNALFAYPSDPRKLQSYVANGGSVTQENYMLKISTGTDAAGSSIASSRRSLQYRPGHEGYAKFTTIFTQGVPNSRQMMGLFDELNGFAIGFEGTNFAIFRKRNGSIVETIIQDNFNRDTLDGNGQSGFLLDPTKGNIYRISFGFLGFATITFEVLAGADNGWIPFHIIDYPNKNTETHITLPYLKIRASVENLGNTSDIIMYSGSVEAGRTNGGAGSVSARSFSYNRKTTYSATTNQRIAVFHNKDTYGGVSNRIESVLKLVSAAAEGNKPVAIDLYITDVAPTGGTWTDKDVASTIRYSTDTTINLTGADLILPLNLGKSSSELIQIVKDIRLLPNQYAIFVYTSTGAGDLNLGIRWEEEF